jgi:ATP-dependent RNA helicase DHX8/PRP22
VTQLGRLMSYFPVEPCLARVVIAGAQHDCLQDILTVAAMLSSEEIWYTPRRKKGGAAMTQSRGGGGGGGGAGDDRFDQHMKRALQARQRLSHPEGDHLTFLAVYNEWLRRGASMQWCLVRRTKRQRGRLCRMECAWWCGSCCRARPARIG